MLLLTLPVLSHAQSFHNLYTMTPWDYDEVTTTGVVDTAATNDGGAALLFALDQFEFNDFTLLKFDPDGSVAENIPLNGIFSDLGLELQVDSTGDLFLDYLGDSIPDATGSTMQVFRYEVDNGLNLRYDGNVVLVNRIAASPYLDSSGFRLIAFDYNTEKIWASRILSTGVAQWTYEVGFSYQSYASQVSFSDKGTLFWTIDSSDEGFPLNFTLVNQAGTILWRKHILKTYISNGSLRIRQPFIYSFRMQLFDDNSSVGFMDIVDESDFETYVLAFRMDSSGNELWTVLLDPEMVMPNFYDPEEVTLQVDPSGRIFYYEKAFGLVGVLDGANAKLREYYDNNGETYYQPITFDDGSLAVRSLLINQPATSLTSTLTQSYQYLNTGFTPIQHGKWIVEYEFGSSHFGPAYFNHISTSQSLNQISVLRSQSPAQLLAKGFVSVEPASYGFLYNLTPVTMSISSSTHSLTNGVANLTLVPNVPITPGTPEPVESSSLATAAFSIGNLTPGDIHYHGGVEDTVFWRSAYFTYPWFQYTVAQATNLTDFAGVPLLLRYGFQESLTEMDGGPFFEKIQVRAPE